MRYIDDFVICFQYRSDALRVQDALRLRLGKFGLTLEPTKTKLVEFGRFAQRHAGKRGRNRPETIYFLGLTLYCTRNRKGNFKVGMRTEKSRLQAQPYVSAGADAANTASYRSVTRSARSTPSCAATMPITASPEISGRCSKVYRAVERYWRRMLRSRSWAGSRLTWDAFNQIKATDTVAATQTAPPLPGAAGARSAVNQLPKSVVREIRTPRSVGTGGGRPPPVTRWMWKRSHGGTSEAPPDERGGNRYVLPTATAPHLDSTDGVL